MNGRSPSRLSCDNLMRHRVHDTVMEAHPSQPTHRMCVCVFLLRLHTNKRSHATTTEDRACVCHGNGMRVQSRAVAVNEPAETQTVQSKDLLIGNVFPISCFCVVCGMANQHRMHYIGLCHQIRISTEIVELYSLSIPKV